MISFLPTQFNWLPRSSAWQDSQNWHARQQQHQANSEAVHTAASELFGSAMVNLGSGMVEITANIATKRAKAAYQKKRMALLDKLA